MPRRLIGRLAYAARVPGRGLPPPQHKTGPRSISSRPLREADVEAIVDGMANHGGFNFGHADGELNLRDILKAAALATAMLGSMMVLIKHIDWSCTSSHNKAMSYVLEREKKLQGRKGQMQHKKMKLAP